MPHEKNTLITRRKEGLEARNSCCSNGKERDRIKAVLLRYIIAYVEKKWSIIYSVPGMNKWMHRNGFSYKKPKGHPHKANREQQEQSDKSKPWFKRNHSFNT
ncbi:winged helix-turn-helix domain-containing protein [Legionella pneumophila serogroup 1]|uniref:Transposase IS630 family n=1 Tax=Legionella pneumophila subsp. pneumophila (strain Philadelphia 1 / ATCC 33152 / DSM 7513) TaxID=272624 RepID=Q5ZUU7_LEGPH|nr:winged helix-turn-helix domain-containing protein [Legionella pneumophila]AAU27775.1 transposase IS630 family [Legionella pneumophila subsp. pneumophila str. Philadelphia 1]AEW51896.1 transposase IS630 family [Legionella pneumophila subsp. pneumophila ATCC 43290]ANH13053.1 DNA-binding protein [Legionella pneumophila]ANH16020.1 DNA-binding protein [Legionella pneumophila]ANH18986.1 DNA-binding protein [Legionella pneumophila]